MRAWRDDEEGAVAVMVGLSLIMLVLVMAVVVDIGLARADRMSNQTRSDLAATAGARLLDPDAAGGFRAACEAALEYFAINTSDADPVQGDPCSVFDSFTCTSATPPRTAEAIAPPYIVRVTVPIGDGHPMMGNQIINEDFDGTDGCERIGVSVTRHRDYLFAGVIGNEGGDPVADAVARRTVDGEAGEYATLIVLDPHGTGVVTLNGNGTAVIVENAPDPLNPGFFIPGIITLDSDGADGPYLISMNATSSRVCAGVDPATTVAIFAAPNANARPACDGDPETLLTEANAALATHPDTLVGPKPQVDPPPVQDGRVTRQPVDHRYNCRAGYYSPGYANTQGSRHWPVSEAGDTPVEACDDAGSRGPHVDDLVDEYGDKTVAYFTAAGWNIGSDCNSNSDQTFGPGNHFINCPGGFKVKPGKTVDFQGPGSIVFAGGIDQQGVLKVNSSDTGDSILFLQSGNIDDTGGGGSFTQLERTFGYLEDGEVVLKSSTRWEAPRSQAYDIFDSSGNLVSAGNCTYASGAPDPACFQNLGFWSNSFTEHDLGGGGTLDLDGIFFSPNAGRASSNDYFNLHGGTNYQLTSAQFFTYNLRVDGGSVISMRPDPNRFVATPKVGGGLIR